MKKSFKALVFVALAAMTAASCAKEEPAPVGPNVHRVTIHAQQDDTKTLIEEGISSASFKWSADDDGRLVVKENSSYGSSLSLDSSDGYETVTIAATFESAAAADYTYSAILAKRQVGGIPEIPVRQTSTGSAYDPDADILVAKSVTFGSPQDELALQFARPVVINKMTLKGLSEGEVISRVLVSADKQITGSYSIAGNSWTGISSEIEINTNQTVPASGQITVYFVSMPVSGVTLTVRAISVNTIYSKTFNRTIDLLRDKVTVFGVSGLTATPKPDYSGTYVMTDATGTKMAKAWVSGENNIKSLNTEFEGGYVYYDPDAVALSDVQLTLARVTDSSSEYYGYYTIEQGEYYLYASSSVSNYIKGKNSLTADCYWDVLQLDGVWTAVARKSSNRNVLQFNDGNSLFSCYEKESQTAIALHTVASMKRSPAIYGENLNIAGDAANGVNTGITFNSNTSSVAAVAYANEGLTSVCDWLSVSVSGTTVNYTVSENSTGADRIAYVKVAATNSESHSVVRVFKVTQSIGVSYVLSFASISAGQNCQDYLSTWTQTCGGHDWELVNFNNNNGGWTSFGYVKCGRKNDASVATITTRINEAVVKVTLNISAITAEKVNSIKLYVSTSSSFSANLQTINASLTSGIQNLIIPNPTENCYYKLEFDCAIGGSNGLVSLTSVTYTAEGSSSSTSYLPGGWLELPSYSTAAMAPTTTSTLTDLYPLKHYATMGGQKARNYTCLYDAEMYTSYWVAYPLCTDHLGTGRDESWAYDPGVVNSKQTNLVGGAYGVSLSTPNYPNNLYSRGHQLPNADRNGVAAMMAQTYYMTNLTPQIQNGFNSPVWSGLEEAVRGIAYGCDTVYVVTGAAFRKANVGTESITRITNKRDGKSIPVPNYYWKALLKVRWTAGTITSASAVGVWMPHADLKGETYASYVVSVNDLETWTGFDLFANLPEALQNTAENNRDWDSFSSF